MERRKAEFVMRRVRYPSESVRSACESVGVTTRQYERWRARDPQFALKCDHVRLSAGDRGVEGFGFVEFRELFFKRDTPLHHLQMIQAIESAPPDSITLILAAPESAKTSLMVDYLCWKFGQNPNFRAALVSESLDLARKILGQIARRMTDDVQFRSYIEAFGPFKSEGREWGKRWNADSITLARSNHDEKEPSLETRGATGQIYGSRYDLLVLDDIQSTTNIGETEKLLNHFRQTMLSRVAQDGGRTIIVGSRVDQGDFYERILEAEDGELVDRVVRIPALTDEGESYWPEYWPLEKLERRKAKVGWSAWARAYLQSPAAVGNQTFPRSLLESRLDRDSRMGVLPSQAERVVCAVDPALDGITALIALGYNAHHCWVVDVEAWPHLGRTEEILARMAEFSSRYRPSHWVAEVGAFQGALARDDRLLELGRRFAFEVIPHTTNRSKADPALGVGSMASAWSLGEITVPYGDENSRLRADKFLKELEGWRAGVPGRLLVQDQVMACWFGWRFWMQQRKLFEARVRVEARPSWASGRRVSA